MELRIRADNEDATSSLWARLVGDFTLSESGSRGIYVMVGPGEVPSLASALATWLRAQRPGTLLTVASGERELMVRAGDPEAGRRIAELLTSGGGRTVLTTDPSPAWNGPDSGGSDFDTDL